MLLVRFRINNETFVGLFERSDYLCVGCVCCSVFILLRFFVFVIFGCLFYD